MSKCDRCGWDTTVNSAHFCATFGAKNLTVAKPSDEIQTLRARVAELEEALETERLRLAGCGVAALGYFDGCKEEYRSASLEDVLRLYNNYKELRAKLDALVPVAWLHSQRSDSDVITDRVKHVWGGVAVGREAKYTIPLYDLKGIKE